MGNLPIFKGDELIKFLEALGFKKNKAKRFSY